MNILRNKVARITTFIAVFGFVMLSSVNVQAFGWFFPVPPPVAPIPPPAPTPTPEPTPPPGPEGPDQESYDLGFADGQAACEYDPSSCDISLAGLLEDKGFGETEPNDKAFSADALVLGEVYHANTFDEFDIDWYSVIATTSNQNLTVILSGDDADTENTSGWLISVRDTAGNIISMFNSSNPGTVDPEAPLQGRNVTTTLNNLGTYYVTIQSFGVAGVFRAYNIALALSETDQPMGPPDQNFTDVELEPNNTRATATPLSSTTNMFAYFDKFPAGPTTFNFDKDWYVYHSEGNEILDLQMCARESCEQGNPWHLEISTRTGNILAQGPIVAGQTIRVALTFAGDYYIQFDTEQTGELLKGVLMAV